MPTTEPSPRPPDAPLPMPLRRTALVSVVVHLSAASMLVWLGPRPPELKPDQVRSVEILFAAPTVAADRPAAPEPQSAVAPEPVASSTIQAAATSPATRTIVPAPPVVLSPPPPVMALTAQAPDPVPLPSPELLAALPPPAHPATKAEPPAQTVVAGVRPAFHAKAQAIPAPARNAEPGTGALVPSLRATEAAAAVPPPPPSATNDSAWPGALNGWLLAHRRYPEAARQHGDEGIVGVAISIARDGRVLAVSITRSSGSSLLDDGVRDMLSGQRVPAFPESMQQAETRVAVNIRYVLGQ